MTPHLQVALDTEALAEALAVTTAVGDVVDVIEAGTVLCLSEGMHAVRELAAVAHGRSVLADLRIVRAGHALARIAFKAGADVVVVMSDAPDDTIAGALRAAHEAGGEIQLELVDGWSFDDARRWYDSGLTQVALHRISEAGAMSAPWTDAETESVMNLATAGLRVTVAGGITLEVVQRAASAPISTFVVGRAITAATDPRAAAADFRRAIRGSG